MPQASLFISGKEYPILNPKKCVITDPNLKKPRVEALLSGDFHLKLEGSTNTNELLNEIILKVYSIKGRLRFYKENRVDKIYDIEFSGAHLESYNKHYNPHTGELEYIEVRLLPEVQRIGKLIYSRSIRKPQKTEASKRVVKNIGGYPFSPN